MHVFLLKFCYKMFKNRTYEFCALLHYILCNELQVIPVEYDHEADVSCLINT